MIGHTSGTRFKDQLQQHALNLIFRGRTGCNKRLTGLLCNSGLGFEPGFFPSQLAFISYRGQVAANSSELLSIVKEIRQ
eukprot:scaffold61245_cov17-Tisochrysis_lutea.AAC.4